MDEALLNRLNGLIEVIESTISSYPSEENAFLINKGNKIDSANIICRSISYQKKVLKSLSPYSPGARILFELYLSQMKKTDTSITDVAFIAEIPGTTALRYVDILEKEELISRKGDPTDRRRFWLILTDKGMDLVENILDQFSKEVMAVFVKRK